MRLAIVTTWFALAVCGMWVLARYAHTPGSATAAPSDWPANAQVQLDAPHPTLVMFVHPHCPCSRASLAELERIVARSDGTLTPWIVFYKPLPAEDGWEQTDLMRTAEKIPGTRIATDTDGQLAQQFGASTSGHTFVYDADGHLKFSGGITMARGHEGDNPGRDAVISLLHGGRTDTATTPVFGCPISTQSGS